MGGKARVIVGAALSIAALVVSGGTAAAYIAPYWGAYISVVAVAYGAWAAREAARKQQNAAGAALEDRKQMVRGGSSVKNIVYGQAWVSGNIVFARQAQTKLDPFLWVVLALPIAHRIEAIEEVWFGDEPITPVDANGFPTGGAFQKRLSDVHVMTGLIPEGNVIIAPGERQQPGEVIQVFGSISCSTLSSLYASGNAVNTGDGSNTINTGDGSNSINTGGGGQAEESRQNVNAYLLTGTRDRIYIPGNVGDSYVLNYQYYWNRPYIRIWRYLGTDDQVANEDLIKACVKTDEPQWTRFSRLRGIPYIILKMHVDPDVFPRDLENITCRIKGKNDILDTRNGTTGYHENPMLIARDYAVTQCGVLPGEIHLDKFHAEVNACDEPITEPKPGVPNTTITTLRYRTHALLSTEVSPIDNLGLILSSCDGSAVWSGNSFDLRCGRFEAPVVTITDSDLVGGIEVIKSPPRMEQFNAVRSRYVNSDKPFWPLEDSPGYYSEYYRIQDGGDPNDPSQTDQQKVMNLDLPATIYTVMAQRIAKQILFKHRSGLRVRFPARFRAMRISPEQTIWLDIKALGFPNKVFRVKSMRQVGPNRVDVEAQEDGPLNYEYNFNEAKGIDPTPNSNLPKIRDVPLIDGLTARTNSQVAVYGDSGRLTAQCQVLWNPVLDALVLNGGRIEIRHKRVHDSEWTYSPALLPRTTEYRFAIQRNDRLMIQARCANSIVTGKWNEPPLEKTASDAPTPPIQSNWLKNAILEGGGTSSPAPVKGWLNAVGQSGTTVDAGGYMKLSIGVINTDAAILYWRTQGTIGTVSYAYSDAVACIPGDRMLGFASVLGKVFAGHPGCFVSVLIVWYDSLGNQLSVDTLGKVSTTSDVTIYFLSHMKHVGGIVTVPSGAENARLVIKAEAALPYNPNTEADAFYAAFYHPYLGGASEGQVTAPPWSS